MRVIVDRNRCEGAAVCVGIAPSVFELDDEDKAVILDPYSVDDDTLRRAAQGCPYEAIILEDENGRHILP